MKPFNADVSILGGIALFGLGLAAEVVPAESVIHGYSRAFYVLAGVWWLLALGHFAIAKWSERGARNKSGDGPLPPQPEPPAVRLRLADPPDAGFQPFLDQADLSVTNDSPEPLTVVVTAFWADHQAQLDRRWLQGANPPLPGNGGQTRFAFVGHLRAGSPDTAAVNDEHNYPYLIGRGYILDFMPPNIPLPGWDVGLNRTQVRVEVREGTKLLVARRFDIYVPEDPRRAMWVVGRGVDGTE